MKSIIQKVQYLILAGLFGFVAVTPAYAAPNFIQNAFSRFFTNNAKSEGKEATRATQNVIQNRNEFREETRENVGTRPGTIKPKIFARAAIGTGQVTAIPGTTLTVLGGDGKTYTVQTDGKTQFRRRFWGKGSLAEIQVGDTVSVIGKWTDATNTTIQATLVRDLSIQKFMGVFFGKVQSITGSGWVMTTVNRGNQTVTASSATITDRTGRTLIQSDVVAGHRVRVRGLWDRKAGTITEVTAVKDFSLPTPTATPTP